MSQRGLTLLLGFISVFSATVSLSGCIINVNAAGISTLEHQQRILNLDSQNLQALIGETGAGSLEIIGVAGASQITLVADIYSNDASKVKLNLEKQGNEARLTADIEAHGNFSDYAPYIDLKLQVPAELALEIDDGSGAIVINSMASNIKVKDGSGELVIHGGNNISIDDGSGAIDVSQLSGNLAITDGSGDITATDIKGSITIDDGSGGIDVANVQGTVTLSDGSGDINVINAKGLTVLAAGSGDVTIDKIDGPVQIN